MDLSFKTISDMMKQKIPVIGTTILFEKKEYIILGLCDHRIILLQNGFLYYVEKNATFNVVEKNTLICCNTTADLMMRASGHPIRAIIQYKCKYYKITRCFKKVTILPFVQPGETPTEEYIELKTQFFLIREGT
jgi:hypothetical protein